jgi:hypothetical protein
MSVCLSTRTSIGRGGNVFCGLLGEALQGERANTKSCYLRLNECFPTRRRFDSRLANGEVRHAEADPITSGP